MNKVPATNGLPSPRWSRLFLLSAVLTSLFHLILHLLGLRTYVSILSGTMAFDFSEALGGLVYLISYGAFILFAPIFLIASGLASLWEIRARKAADPPSRVT